MHIKFRNNSYCDAIISINETILIVKSQTSLKVKCPEKTRFCFSVKSCIDSRVEKIKGNKLFFCSILTMCEYSNVTSDTEIIFTYVKTKISEKIYYERFYIDSINCDKISENFKIIKYDFLVKTFKNNLKKELLKESFSTVIADHIVGIITSGIGLALIFGGLSKAIGLYTAIKIVILFILFLSIIMFTIGLIMELLYDKFSKFGRSKKLYDFKKYLSDEYVNYYYSNQDKKQDTDDGSPVSSN